MKYYSFRWIEGMCMGNDSKADAHSVARTPEAFLNHKSEKTMLKEFSVVFFMQQRKLSSFLL